MLRENAMRAVSREAGDTGGRGARAPRIQCIHSA